MGLFSLGEVFQIAMQAEESGRLLYVSVAKDASDPKVVDLCKKLAAQEGMHYEKFKAMKEAQPERNSRRLSLEEMEFVDGLVQGRVTPLESEARRVAKENSLSKVLDLAIQAELDSAALYEQILPAVDAAEVSAIREIIEEEKRHYRILTEYRKEMKD